MNLMAKEMQVITITHLPQIASKGQNHLFVYKEDKHDKTFSNIKKLSSEEQVAIEKWKKPGIWTEDDKGKEKCCIT